MKVRKGVHPHSPATASRFFDLVGIAGVNQVLNLDARGTSPKLGADLSNPSQISHDQRNIATNTGLFVRRLGETVQAHCDMRQTAFHKARDIVI